MKSKSITTISTLKSVSITWIKKSKPISLPRWNSSLFSIILPRPHVRENSGSQIMSPKVLGTRPKTRILPILQNWVIRFGWNWSKMTWNETTNGFFYEDRMPRKGMVVKLLYLYDLSGLAWPVFLENWIITFTFISFFFCMK